MKRHALLFSFCLLGPALGLQAVSADLKVSGHQIVTVSGNCPIFFKGVNAPSMEWLNAPDGPPASSNGVLTTTQTVVANWGANIVRVPLNQDRWLGTACGVNATTYQGYVDAIVNWCNANNVYVLLDLHWSDTGTAGGGNVCSSGQHDMPDDNSSTFWTSVATRYKNNPAVLFDLYNEPKGITNWTLWRNGGTGMTDGGYHSPGMQGLLSTVRATGANNIIVAGGLDWAFNLTGVPANALTDTASGHGVVYATHIYPWKASPCTRAGGCFDNAIPAAVHSNYAVMVTEFGQDNNANGVPNNTWSQSVMDWAKANTNGYIAWCLHTGATPNLVSDWSYTPTNWFGTTVKADMLATSGGGCVGTPTYTATLTRTPTRTATRTATQIATRTPTPTDTRTATRTATRSATQSSTPTRTATPANSTTDTPTLSSTRTDTRTITRTSTPSATPTSSPTATRTNTPMGTLTDTRTSSPTATRTNTPLGTLTDTPTSSPTATRTNTPVGTLTDTPTSSPTATRTNTPVGTLTDTPVGTLTDTPVGTLTDTPTPAAATFGNSSLVIVELVPFPNPNPRSMRIQLSGPADSVTLVLYTKAEVRAKAWNFTGLAAGWVQLPLGADWATELANGPYYLVAVAQQAQRHSERKVAKAYLLR